MIRLRCDPSVSRLLAPSHPFPIGMKSRTASSKDRLDHLMVARGLAQSRDAAVRLILAGAVKVAGQPVDKPAKAVPVDAPIDVQQTRSRYVSRGGEKLAAALETGLVPARNAVCLDVGASTGGFTDCLLQHGAARVYAVDVGYGQIDWRLRQDPRVVLRERTNIRHIDASAIPEPIDVAVIDVSFISLKKVLPALTPLLRPHATVIALVKPQFEVGKGQVGRGGVVRDDTQRHGALHSVVACADELGFRMRTTLDSPIKGKKGNREILVLFEFRGDHL